MEDDPRALEDAMEFETQAVPEKSLPFLTLMDDENDARDEENDGGRPESCIISSITEA